MSGDTQRHNRLRPTLVVAIVLALIGVAWFAWRGVAVGGGKGEHALDGGRAGTSVPAGDDAPPPPELDARGVPLSQRVGHRPVDKLRIAAGEAADNGDRERALELLAAAWESTMDPALRADVLRLRAGLLSVSDRAGSIRDLEEALKLWEQARGDTTPWQEWTGWNEAHLLANKVMADRDFARARQIVEPFVQNLVPGEQHAAALGYLASIAQAQGDAKTQIWALEQILEKYPEDPKWGADRWYTRLQLLEARDPARTGPEYVAFVHEALVDETRTLERRHGAGSRWLDALRRANRVAERLEGMVQMVTMIDRAGPEAAHQYETTLRSMFSSLSSADAYGRADLALWALARSRELNAGNELILRSIDAQEQILRDKLARPR